ncbi:MAG: hypothetical protein CSA29_05795 [Desulfobacterales bacterium]|nr:MAG: hypothetical protein CSA29_05795 [Desulfobacterales bacterium]
MIRSKKNTAPRTVSLMHSFHTRLTRLAPGKVWETRLKRTDNGKEDRCRITKSVNRSGGFTLIEMLLALSIFALVISTLYTGFNTVMSPVNSFRFGRVNHEAARNAMSQIKRDLLSVCLTRQAAYLSSDRQPSQEADRFRFLCETQSVGQSQNSFSRLRFASFEHLTFNREYADAIGIITYEVRPGAGGTLVLQRRDLASVLSPSLDNDTASQTHPILCDRVKAFELKFMDREGNFHEEWDSDSSDYNYESPVAVSIKLETGDANQSYLFETTVRLPVERKNNEPAPR